MNPSDDGPLSDEQRKTIHNKPENKELGSCSCPVCEPEIYIPKPDSAVLAKYDPI